MPDRPGQTNPPNVVPTGIVQIETGFLRQVDNADDITTTNFLYNSSLIRIGLRENCELRCTIEYAGIKTDSGNQSSNLNGFHPISIGTKLAVCPENGIIPQTAFNVSVALPYFGKQEFKPQYLAPSFFFLMQHTLSDRYVLGYNLGLQWDGNLPNATAIYSICMTVNVLEGLSMYGECYGFSPEKSVSEYLGDIGCAYLLTNDLQLDFSAGFRFNAVAPESFIAFGLSWRTAR